MLSEQPHQIRIRDRGIQWFIAGLHEDLLVIHRSDLYDDERDLTVPSEWIGPTVRRWADSEPTYAAHLIRVYYELHGSWVFGGRPPSVREFEDVVVPGVLEAFRSGELVAIRLATRRAKAATGAAPS